MCSRIEASGQCFYTGVEIGLPENVCGNFDSAGRCNAVGPCKWQGSQGTGQGAQQNAAGGGSVTARPPHNQRTPPCLATQPEHALQCVDGNLCPRQALFYLEWVCCVVTPVLLCIYLSIRCRRIASTPPSTSAKPQRQARASPFVLQHGDQPHKGKHAPAPLFCCMGINPTKASTRQPLFFAAWGSKPLRQARTCPFVLLLVWVGINRRVLACYA